MSWQSNPPTTRDWTERLASLRKKAEAENWTEVDFQPHLCRLDFVKEGIRVIVYYSKMTVGVWHDGDTQWFKNQSYNKLIAIFRNPPKHEFLRPER